MSVFKQRTATVRIYGIEDFDKNGTDELAIYSFTFPECFIEFTVSQIETDAPNSCYLKIFGISKDTYKIFEEGKFKKYNKQQICEIYCGYDRNEELLYRGNITRVLYNFNLGEQYIEFILDQNMKKYKTQRHSICIQRQTNVYEALNIVCKKFGYILECRNEDVLKSLSIAPITLEGNVEKCLGSILNKKASYYVDANKIITFGVDKGVILNKDATPRRIYTLLCNNGLRSYPVLDTNKTDTEDRYKITNKILPGISAGDVVKIPISEDGLFSDIDTGKYVEYIVQEFTSRFTNNQDSTEMECVKRNG